jgi:hypothetical protein
MIENKICMRMASALLLWGCCVFVGCSSAGGATDTLPPAFEDRLARLDTESGVALRFLPTPDAERIEVNMGSISLPMNRLFSGMLREMAEKKFERIDRASANKLEVAITYLNLEERAYMGTAMLHRVEMAVIVKADDGAHDAQREIAHFTEADVEGYSVRSDQLYDLLLQFVTSIDGFVGEHFRSRQ